MADHLIQKYGEFWERGKMFDSTDGRVEWSDKAWPKKGAPIEGACGVYVLYRGDSPIYVGKAVQGENPLAARIRTHAKDWLSPWWDSVCWYDFGDNAEAAEIAEALLITHVDGLYNASTPGGQHFGDRCFMEGESWSTNTLWG